MDLGRFGIWVLASDVSANAARVIESLGFGALWVGGSPTGKLAEVQGALDATESMVVATGIVNMWRDEATGAAAAYQQIQGRHPDRFLLGVGIGHPEATAEYRNPSGKLAAAVASLTTATSKPSSSR